LATQTPPRAVRCWIGFLGVSGIIGQRPLVESFGSHREGRLRAACIGAAE